MCNGILKGMLERYKLSQKVRDENEVTELKFKANMLVPQNAHNKVYRHRYPGKITVTDLKFQLLTKLDYV